MRSWRIAVAALLLVAAPGVALAGEDCRGRVAAGGHHSMAVRGDGSLWTWGRNYAGQLGVGSTQNQPVPTRVVFADE